MFCVRNPQGLREARGGGWLGDHDPLATDFVEGRLRLLEIMASASLRGQSFRDFTWIVIVDPALPEEARERIRELGGDLRLFLHDYQDDQDWHTAQWLSSYLEAPSDFLLTTHLDDDDSLGITYLGEVRTAAENFVSSSDHGLVRIFGTRSIWLWNRIRSPGAPLGTRSRWAGSNKISGCGLSVVCRPDRLSLTVLSLRHKRAADYLAFEVPTPDPAVERVRTRVRAALERSGSGPALVPSDLGFEDLSLRTEPVLVTNHSRNVQSHRLYKPKLDPVVVTGAETFVGHSLDWSAAVRYPPSVRESWWDRFRRVVARGRRAVMSGRRGWADDPIFK
jgi:hypothetical protein